MIEWILANLNYASFASGMAVIVTVLVLVNLAMALRWIKDNRARMFYLLPILLWLVHAAYFYIQINLRNLGGDFGPTIHYTAWAWLIQFHAQITILAMLVFHSRYRLRSLTQARRSKELVEDMVEEVVERINGSAHPTRPRAEDAGFRAKHGEA